MKIRTLEDLFLTELQDIYGAERLILATVAKPDMRRFPFLTGYIAFTQHRVERLEQVFELLGRQPSAGTRPTTEGMLAEIDELIGASSATPDDANAILSVVETVRQYLLARYAALASWANELRMPDASKLITAMLQEVRGDSQQLSPAPARHDNDPGKGPSMGERLTAIFDRKL